MSPSNRYWFKLAWQKLEMSHLFNVWTLYTWRSIAELNWKLLLCSVCYVLTFWSFSAKTSNNARCTYAFSLIFFFTVVLKTSVLDFCNFTITCQKPTLSLSIVPGVAETSCLYFYCYFFERKCWFLLVDTVFRWDFLARNFSRIKRAVFVCN